MKDSTPTPGTVTLDPASTDQATGETTPSPNDGLGDGGLKALQAERDARKQAQKELTQARSRTNRPRCAVVPEHPRP